MSNVLSFPQEITNQTIVGLDTRLKMQLTPKEKEALVRRYGEIRGVSEDNARASVRTLYERGHEYVMTLREQLAYFGPLYPPVDPLDMEEDDYIVGGVVTFIPDADVVLLGED